METYSSTLTNQKSRLGFHYFPDTLHYRERDLATWLPEMEALGASWLVIQSPTDRAIPEAFFHALLQAGIEPLIQFPLSLGNPPDTTDLDMLLDAYARWGARHVIFFDRPNARASWPGAGWAQQDLIERFLDRYLPLALQARACDLLPVLPPLEPGGNYWDTAFLRALLASLERRKQSDLLQNLALSANAWTAGRSLNWGAGGADAWPETRPYLTPSGSQDQIGFRIFDWYESVAQTMAGKTYPIFLLNAGVPANPVLHQNAGFDLDQHAQAISDIARLAYGQSVNEASSGIPLKPIPPQVTACCFWQLADEADSPFYAQAWYQGETQLPAVAALKQVTAQTRQAAGPKSLHGLENGVHPIQHYLLLPTYEWGVAEWHLDVIRPYIRKCRPTVGFSVGEAFLAEKVTVVGNEALFSDDILSELRAAGCVVERISGDGTSIATQLAER